MNTITIEANKEFKEKALQWASTFDTYCCLNYSNLTIPYAGYNPFPSILAVGREMALEVNQGNCFEQLKEFQKSNDSTCFGYFSYELKNEIEKLQSNNPDYLNFPDLFFFVPKHIIEFSDNKITIHSEDPNTIVDFILNQKLEILIEIDTNLSIQQRTSQKEYIDAIEKIKYHLLEGDIYELNYCIEFYAKKAIIQPIEIFKSLTKHYPMPFSSLLRNKDKYLISASPERFLKKEGNKLISQPMKGTCKRSSDLQEDARLKKELENSEKEQTENRMIVDLVRNDLARSSKPGSVKVEELFGVYSLSNVHQMISTISSELKDEIHFIDAIKNAFPMGSMTGAPKISAMQIIDKLENNKRGLYSGAMGYISQNGDFDFNVVIRSILYNSTNEYLSFQAGSAIIYDSIAEKEYEECLLKASTLANLLAQA